MSQTSKPQQDETDKISSYEDLKKQMMNQLDSSSDSLASVDTPAPEIQRVQPDSVLDAPVETPTVSSDTDGEVSVEDYMNRLLNRSTSENQSEKETAAPKNSTAANTASEDLLKETFAEELEEREKMLQPVKLTKATLPELEASFLSEMRNVSRQSADHAIIDCEQRKYKSSASIQLGIGASLVGFGLLQTMVAPTLANTTLVALPCYTLAIYFFWRYTQWRNLTRKSKSLSQSAKAIQLDH